MLDRRGFFAAVACGLLAVLGLREKPAVGKVEWWSCWSTAETATADTSVTYWTTSDPKRFRGRNVVRFDPPNAADKTVWMEVEGPHPLSQYPPEPAAQREWDALERGEG